MRKVYRCEHTVPPVLWFTFADRNALGEEIVVEFRKNENTHGKHSLPAMWKRKGFIDKEPETWWGVQTYVTDRQGRCSGKYNPTTKDGKLNFEWLLEATEENRQKIMMRFTAGQTLSGTGKIGIWKTWKKQSGVQAWK